MLILVIAIGLAIFGVVEATKKSSSGSSATLTSAGRQRFTPYNL